MTTIRTAASRDPGPLVRLDVVNGDNTPARATCAALGMQSTACHLLELDLR